MTDRDLSWLDTSKYEAVLSACCRGLDQLILCDGAGAALWSGGDGEAVAALAALSAQDAEWFLANEPKAATLEGGTRAAYVGLYSDDGSQFGAIAAVSGEDDAGLALAAVVRLIEDEGRLNRELDNMAQELTERYEELNLVYNTEDQVNYFEEGQEALNKLVQNCCEYMDVSLSGLLLPAKGIRIEHCVAGIEQMPGARGVLAQHGEALFRKIHASMDSLVMNDLDDPLRLELGLDIPYRVLCVPVLDGASELTGALCVIRHHRLPDFSNSDRNLLLVMAKKTSKIIQANFDSLTGLMSRSGFEFYLHASHTIAHFKGVNHSILHINVDRTQVVNDTLGHDAGDELIREIGRVTRATVRDTDTIARLRGDEFGVLLESCPLDQGTRIAEKLCAAVKALTFDWRGQRIEPTVSVGVATLGPSNDSVVSVLTAAEVACAAAKELGRGRVQSYEQSDVDLVQREEQMHWVSRIQTALREDRFTLYSQRIDGVDPRAGHSPHFEILVRLRDRDGEMVSPGMFIPAAERYHLMPAIDRWVLKTSINTLSQWWQTGHGDGVWSLNLSGQSLGDKDFIRFTTELIRRSPIPGENICFEITETAAIANLDDARMFITGLKEIGCRFSLDDFGTGLSSFAYLKSLEVDYLKIDGAFIRDVVTDPVAESMVSSINHIGHVMGLQTVAEFVENQAIIDKLAELKVDFAQGYALQRPIPIAEQIGALGDG